MAPLIVSSPTATALFVLLERLHGLADAVAIPHFDGGWDVRVSLDGAARDILPLALSATREWLDECNLPSATVSVDGQAHLLTGSVAPEPAA